MQKFIRIFLFICFTLSALQGSAQKQKEAAPKWLSLTEVDSLMKIEPRPILIDLYTDWCGWCKVMDKKTYTDPEVIAAISKNFYPVKFNAESKETFNWDKYKFAYDARYRVNEFTIYLTKGKFYFPQTVFIFPHDPQPKAVTGYLDKKDFLALLEKMMR